MDEKGRTIRKFPRKDEKRKKETSKENWRVVGKMRLQKCRVSENTS